MDISDGVATIKLTYHERLFCFIQSKNDITSSNNIVSDRATSSVIYNDWLNQNVTIEKNELSNNLIEYSTCLNFEGAVYYLYGVMDEEEFINIVSYLSF